MACFISEVTEFFTCADWGQRSHSTRVRVRVLKLSLYGHVWTSGAVAIQLNAQCSRRVWGHAPLGKFLNLDHMRVLLRPSETTITMQNV